MIIVILLSACLGFFYRIRGGALTLSNDTVSRAFWAVPVGIIMMGVSYLHHIPAIVGLASGILAFAGVSIGHGFAQRPGLSPNLQMSLVGFTRLEMILCPLWFFQIFTYHGVDHVLLWVTLFGALQGLAYFLCYNVFDRQGRHLTLFGVNWCNPGSELAPDSSWGEFFAGYAYALAFVVSVL